MSNFDFAFDMLNSFEGDDTEKCGHFASFLRSGASILLGDMERIRSNYALLIDMFSSPPDGAKGRHVAVAQMFCEAAAREKHAEQLEALYRKIRQLHVDLYAVEEFNPDSLRVFSQRLDNLMTDAKARDRWVESTRKNISAQLAELN